VLSVPYERIVQWVSGPISGAVGYGVTELVTHCGVLGSAANGHQAAITNTVVKATTFGITTLVTYAAHHKWLDNAAKWWDSNAAQAERAVVTGTGSSPGVGIAISDVNRMVQEILTGQAAAENIQSLHGTDPEPKQVDPQTGRQA
jgi:hypothetical protein